ncbi:D-isomer specific 2-hydroxyacid dehydrogenase family protein [Pectinatus brassicae]|uniref:D-lactate dehydrogenase n=1 Tax=Pectinatus brassicae TaxID=862415 RepID=A0A840UJY5_9FIRM|nr:D-isomer specific 2-hydroxyacid dehydrogenase family protein [Pectinatus brassicae]MBB5337456.1 D-lactate dehydrogenase [Pectinatus brassicae]
MSKEKICVFSYRDFDEAEYFTRISQELNIELIICRENITKDNFHLAKGCTAISILTTLIDDSLMKELHDIGIKVISTRSIGFDHIDLKAAQKYNMHICNASYPTNGVADYAIMLMMMAARNMKRIMERAAIQDFSLPGLQGRELPKLTVGIIGAGRIGQTVIKHLSGFGNPILVFDKYQSDEVKKYARYVEFDELIAQSDIISLHAPLTEENHHMINAQTIAKMKDKVIIVNTARGGLIDSDALINAIENGKIGAAGLDVVEDEFGLYYNDLKSQPLTNRHLAILRNYPNVIVTPHMAFYTDNDVHDMVYSSLKGCLLEAAGEKNPWRVFPK